MDTKQVLDKLDSYAKELLENGIVNNEINGVRERLWSDLITEPTGGPVSGPRHFASTTRPASQRKPAFIRRVSF